MYSKVNYTVVGLFVLLFSAGLLWFGFWLAKVGLQENFSLYKLEMKESVSGLSKDSNVKLRGVNIGRVSAIRINPENIESIEILLEIKENIPIKEDMLASTQMLGITGLLSIEIEGGTNGAKTLIPTKSYIPLIPSKPSLLSKLTNNLDSLSDKLENLLSDKHIETLGKILDNTQKLTAKGEILEDKAIISLEEASTDFKQMQKDFTQIKDVTVPTVDKLFETSKNFNRVVLKFEKSLDRGDYNFKKMLEPILVEIQILSNQLNSMSRELGQNPSDILFKSRKSRRGPGE
ncbi:MAG: MlaD family protein [Sulfurovum sp.]|nr:MlaD family protein [Sulfurovum sp.]